MKKKAVFLILALMLRGCSPEDAPVVLPEPEDAPVEEVDEDLESAACCGSSISTVMGYMSSSISAGPASGLP